MTRWTECVQNLVKNEPTEAMAVMNAGDTVLGGLKNGKIKVWDLARGSDRTLTGHKGSVTALTVLRDGTVVSASKDKTLKMWDVKSERCLRTLEGHSSMIWSVIAVGPFLVSGSSDSTVKVWNPHTGECVHTLNGHTRTVWSLVRLDDKHVISGSKDGSLRLWNVKTGRCLRVISDNNHSIPVGAIGILSDGRTISTSADPVGKNQNLRVWPRLPLPKNDRTARYQQLQTVFGTDKTAQQALARLDDTRELLKAFISLAFRNASLTDLPLLYLLFTLPDKQGLEESLAQGAQATHSLEDRAEGPFIYTDLLQCVDRLRDLEAHLLTLSARAKQDNNLAGYPLLDQTIEELRDFRALHFPPNAALRLRSITAQPPSSLHQSDRSKSRAKNPYRRSKSIGDLDLILDLSRVKNAGSADYEHCSGSKGGKSSGDESGDGSADDKSPERKAAAHLRRNKSLKNIMDPSNFFSRLSPRGLSPRGSPRKKRTKSRSQIGPGNNTPSTGKSPKKGSKISIGLSFTRGGGES